MKKELAKLPRIIGKYVGDKNGPLLLVTAGVHGNEPSGIKTLQKIFSVLEQKKPAMKGVFLGLSGNLRAIRQGQRFIDEDLNRTWTKENLIEKENSTHEIKEMNEIIELLKTYPKENFPTRFFIDCHSTSSDSLPYISVQEVGENDTFAHKFPLYIVRGFSDIVNGSIDKYFSGQGFTGFAFEGGQHVAETTYNNQKAMILLALKEVNTLDLSIFSDAPMNQIFGEQKTFEIIYRHGLQETDEFKMRPGFKNFEKIRRGQLLATQNGKEIKSEWNAYIFMPLYQEQGNDGFFVVKDVSNNLSENN